MATKAKKPTVKSVQVFAPGYRSRATGGQLVAPGVYPADSTELLGADAGRIVETGAGAWATSRQASKLALEDLPDDEANVKQEDIYTMSKEQLIAHAAQYGIDAPATGEERDDWLKVVLDYYGF